MANVFFYQAINEAINMPEAEILQKQKALKKLKEKFTKQTMQEINKVV